MSFGTTPLSTTTLGTNQFPVSAVAVPNEPGSNLTAMEGGPESTDTNGNKTAPLSVYLKDGINITEGAKADSAVTDATTTNTKMSFLKGLVKIWADVWDSVNHWLQVKVMNTVTVSGAVTTTGTVTEANSATISTNTANIPAKGTAIMAGSTPVTIATNDTVFSELLLDTDNLATIVTNTNKIPASPAQESGNLATLAGIVSSNKAAVKAASGDFADGSQVAIGTTTQTKATDGSATSWSVIQLLKGILDRFINGTIAVTGTFWQTIQPVSGTVTSNAGTNLNTSALALEAGGNLATLVPGVQGWIAATGTGTASQDDTLTFASQVRKVVLYNASANSVPFEFDATSAATSFPIQPGQSMVFDSVFCTTVHVFPSALLPINTTSGLYVKGWK